LLWEETRLGTLLEERVTCDFATAEARESRKRQKGKVNHHCEKGSAIRANTNSLFGRKPKNEAIRDVFNTTPHDS